MSSFCLILSFGEMNIKKKALYIYRYSLLYSICVVPTIKNSFFSVSNTYRRLSSGKHFNSYICQ
jgi:hypothetical protein